LRYFYIFLLLNIIVPRASRDRVRGSGKEQWWSGESGEWQVLPFVAGVGGFCNRAR